MKRGLYLFCLLAVWAWVPLVYANDTLVVGDFSGQPEAGRLPVHWQPLLFDGVDQHTIYSHTIDGGRGALMATSRHSSSGLVRKIKIPPGDYPNLFFSWKIDRVIDKANLRQKRGDDAPARLYITFAYDASKVSFWELVKFETIKLFYGEYPPIAALTYVWASHVPVGTILESPYTNRVKIMVLESGEKRKGQWLTQQRNIVRDYRLAFGDSEVPVISGVAIMTDTDNTNSQAVAWYGDIIFSQ